MRRFLMTLAAAGAVWFLPVHIGLLAVLAYIWAAAATSTTNTAKTRAVETRVNNLQTSQTAQNQRVNNLSGTSTSTGQPAGQLSGGPSPSITTTSSAYPTGQTSSALSGSNAHTHDYGGHWHDMNGHGHAIMGHTHNLPTV